MHYIQISMTDTVMENSPQDVVGLATLGVDGTSRWPFLITNSTLYNIVLSNLVHLGIT